MARRDDSGWRDADLTKWHTDRGFACPAAGTVLPMIEYDRGRAVGLVNYIPRGNPLPNGEAEAAVYRALGRLHQDADGRPLPFITAVYDPTNWAMRVFPHNETACSLMGLGGHFTRSWHGRSEYEFAEMLFRMRGRKVPDMFGMGVQWNTGSWLADDPVPARGNLTFPCADMSARRRAYEPAVAAPMRFKVPCLDIDLAVVDRDDRLALVVDYKRRGAVCDVTGTNATALASLAHPNHDHVIPAFMTRYHGDGDDWWFETYALNRTASQHLAYVLGSMGVPDEATINALACTIAGRQWVRLTQHQWYGVLATARDL